METIMRPVSWDEFPTDARLHFEALRAPGIREKKVLNENFFIESVLGSTVLGGLSDEDLEGSRARNLAPSARQRLRVDPAKVVCASSPRRGDHHQHPDHADQGA